MDELKNFLTQVKMIVQLNEEKRKEKEERGELFNVFEVMNLQYNDTRTHSSLLVRSSILQEGAYRLDVRIRLLPDLIHLVKRQAHRFRNALHPDPRFDGPDYLDRCPGAYWLLQFLHSFSFWSPSSPGQPRH